MSGVRGRPGSRRGRRERRRSIWGLGLPNGGAKFPKEDATPSPQDQNPETRDAFWERTKLNFAGQSQALQLPAPRSSLLPTSPCFWALSLTTSPDKVRHPCPRLPWSQSADSAKTAALPSRLRPWPPAVPSALPGPAAGGGAGGGAGFPGGVSAPPRPPPAAAGGSRWGEGEEREGRVEAPGLAWRYPGPYPPS